MSCAALSCSSRTTIEGVKNTELSFHRFPKCPQIREQWIQAVGRVNWEPTQNSRLCSKHFEQSCFIEGVSRKQLKTESVPTIFEGRGKSYLFITRKREALAHQKEAIFISPRQQKSLEKSGVEATGIRITPKLVVKILQSLEKAQLVAARRLRTLKTLRETNRRLVKKNARLTNIINQLKMKNS